MKSRNDGDGCNYFETGGFDRLPISTSVLKVDFRNISNSASTARRQSVVEPLFVTTSSPKPDDALRMHRISPERPPLPTYPMELGTTAPGNFQRSITVTKPVDVNPYN